MGTTSLRMTSTPLKKDQTEMQATASLLLSRLTRIGLLCLTLAAVSGFSFSWRSSAPELWEGWEVHDNANSAKIDHSTWDSLLKRYVTKGRQDVNLFGYGKVSRQDRERLDEYIKSLAALEITAYSRSEQLAYWLNLYNALTVQVILQHYPVKSIKDIDISGLLANGPWGKELVEVEGEKLSLDNIEHEILRPGWKDPRIHYGVNCASIGCPNLQPDAFTGASVDDMLTAGAKQYVNSPRGLSIRNGRVTVSKIYSWFAYDFGNSKEGVMRHLLKYASAERAHQLKTAGDIHDTRYDWALNE